MIIIIAAVSQNGVIGRDGRIPWKLKSDMRDFKNLTTGNTVVMGRKTWDSFPKRPLPNRQNIVVTRQNGLILPGAEVAHSLSEALKLAKAEKIFIIGGAALYKEGFEVADAIAITRVLAHIEGDTYFPAFDKKVWRIAITEKTERDPADEYDSLFELYSRAVYKPSPSG